MLQQTQVSRALSKYKEFLRSFPTVRALAHAPLQDVLKIWSGLGYNRRAKFLYEAAKKVTTQYKGRFPKEYSALRTLPGVGDYTAKAVRVFAFNEPETLIETNVRTVFIHTFFPTRKISDTSVLKLARIAAEGQDPRRWHSALMDYGAHLKQSGVRINSRSKHYVKQSKFEGSLRQVRGAILKAVTQMTPIEEVRSRYTAQFDSVFATLVREGLITRSQ